MTAKTKKLKKQIKLGEFIKQMRLDRGYSQAELAVNLGYMSPQFISDWERGISSPPVKKLPELASLLDVKTDVIFNLLVDLAKEQLVASLSKEYNQIK